MVWVCVVAVVVAVVWVCVGGYCHPTEWPLMFSPQV